MSSESVIRFNQWLKSRVGYDLWVDIISRVGGRLFIASWALSDSFARRDLLNLGAMNLSLSEIESGCPLFASLAHWYIARQKWDIIESAHHSSDVYGVVMSDPLRFLDLPDLGHSFWRNASWRSTLIDKIISINGTSSIAKRLKAFLMAALDLGDFPESTYWHVRINHLYGLQCTYWDLLRGVTHIMGQSFAKSVDTLTAFPPEGVSLEKWYYWTRNLWSDNLWSFQLVTNINSGLIEPTLLAGIRHYYGCRLARDPSAVFDLIRRDRVSAFRFLDVTTDDEALLAFGRAFPRLLLCSELPFEMVLNALHGVSGVFHSILPRHINMLPANFAALVLTLFHDPFPSWNLGAPSMYEQYPDQTLALIGKSVVNNLLPFPASCRGEFGSMAKNPVTRTDIGYFDMFVQHIPDDIVCKNTPLETRIDHAVIWAIVDTIYNSVSTEAPLRFSRNLLYRLEGDHFWGSTRWTKLQNDPVRFNQSGMQSLVNWAQRLRLFEIFDYLCEIFGEETIIYGSDSGFGSLGV